MNLTAFYEILISYVFSNTSPAALMVCLLVKYDLIKAVHEYIVSAWRHIIKRKIKDWEFKDWEFKD